MNAEQQYNLTVALKVAMRNAYGKNAVTVTGPVLDGDDVLFVATPNERGDSRASTVNDRDGRVNDGRVNDGRVNDRGDGRAISTGPAHLQRELRFGPSVHDLSAEDLKELMATEVAKLGFTRFERDRAPRNPNDVSADHATGERGHADGEGGEKGRAMGGERPLERAHDRRDANDPNRRDANVVDGRAPGDPRDPRDTRDVSDGATNAERGRPNKPKNRP